MNSVGQILVQDLFDTLSPLAYFNRFQTPLTFEEIYNHLPKKTSVDELKERLEHLCQIEIIQQEGPYFFLKKSYDSNWIAKKISGQKATEKALNKAQAYSRIIRCFPFVRGIYLSGSLSKDYFDKDSDIDYFIITEPGRLWLCRSFLIAFKKVFLLNSRKYFCVNYFIDKEHLEVPDQNIFVATEIMHLIPAWNVPLLESFQAKNHWVRNFLPQHKGKKIPLIDKNEPTILQKTGEFLFKGFLGEKLDDAFFRMTLNRWKKKFTHFSESDFDLQLRTRKNVSKHHPRGYQKIVLEHYHQIMSDLKNELSK